MGCRCRMASSLVTHRRNAAAASTVPSPTSETPITSRPHGTARRGRNWVAARPPATNASAVRIHARKVRSLANENR